MISQILGIKNDELVFGYPNFETMLNSVSKEDRDCDVYFCIVQGTTEYAYKIGEIISSKFILNKDCKILHT